MNYTFSPRPRKFLTIHRSNGHKKRQHFVDLRFLLPVMHSKRDFGDHSSGRIAASQMKPF